MISNNKLRFFSERGFLRGTIGSLVLLAISLACFLYFFGTVVPPGMMGVRQINFGPGQGFSEKGLAPGYHPIVPTYSTIHLVPRTLQILHLVREDEANIDTAPALEIQTADRATVDVDISIISRFYDQPLGGEGAHGGPADLLQRIGITNDRWENHIRRTVDDQLKRTLGQLKTPEFYNPFKREKQIELALGSVNALLAPDGVVVDAVLLRRYTYRAERIDNAIFQKNLQVQEERLNEAASELAKAHADLEQVAAELDAQIQTKLVDGENKARVIKSEGDLFESKRKAEADLLVAKARAEVDRLRASALAQSVGASVFVAREMAPLLASLKGGVVTDLDPYDIQKWMKRLGVQGK